MKVIHINREKDKDKLPKDSEEVKLLKRFIDACFINDEYEQREAFTALRQAIFDYLPDYRV